MSPDVVASVKARLLNQARRLEEENRGMNDRNQALADENRGMRERARQLGWHRVRQVDAGPGGRQLIREIGKLVDAA